MGTRTARPTGGPLRPPRNLLVAMALHLLLGAACFGVAALGVTTPAAAQGAAQAFSSFDVRGNQRIDDATVLTYAGIEPGQRLTAGQLNAALQRVRDSGLFRSVQAAPSGGTLVITVEELPTINEINVEGNARLDDELLLGLVNSQPRRVYSPTQAEADARAITEAYRQAGRLAAVVMPRIIPRSQNRVDLVFEVIEGGVVEVERIGFVGNRSFSDRRLRQVLATKQAGIFRRFIAADIYQQDRIQFDRQVLTDFYRSRGFVDFEVLSTTTEFSRERNAFFLTFNLREGQQFDLGRISVGSQIPGVPAQRYLDVPRIRSGQTYTPNRIDDTIARLERAAIRDGLNFVRVEPQITRNDRALTLDVDFVLTRGPRVFVERIDIEGNATTLDRVIRRQFDIVEGDPFNPREIRESAERIRALGFFSDVQVQAREGSAADRVIVDVDVEEQPTGSLTFGVNFSLEDGVGVAVGLSERNFLGRGQLLNFQLGAGLDNTDSVLTFSEPALLGRDLRGTIELYFRTTNSFSADYDTQEVGVEPSLGFPISDNGRLELRYRLSQDDLFNVDDGNDGDPRDNGSSVILQREEGAEITSSVGYTYSFDSRRAGLDPNTGVRFEFGQDFAGVGGDAEYIRTLATVGYETRLMNEDVGYFADLTGGALTSLGGDSRILDRFRAGGRVRGFSRNGLGPRDLTASNEDALGGNYLVAFNTEVDFPLGLPEEYGIRGGLFFDAGSIWDLDDTDGTGGEVDDGFELRAAAGASIFISTPIGPLRLDFSRALLREDFDEVRNFNLSVSTRF